MEQDNNLSHGACLWNCATSNPHDAERGSVAFRAGTGGLHSAEN